MRSPVLRRHVILVGLPGAGKSTVGRLLAAALGADVRDIDLEVERRAGMRVAEIFESYGEAGFRALERREADRAIAGAPAVVIPGGGWAAQPGNLAAVRGRALTVYLHASAEKAAGRVASQGGRPLLDDAEPVGRMRSLLAERSGYYEQCDVRVETEGKSPEELALEIAELALEAGVG